ncbi:hypothetical protein COJ01_17075 [Priestia megaterium]|nr:DUF4376 domain-containing protein [Priestia megaterium]PFK99784.1 hypothetical protein COJ01_17075 [Priestia megaterium]
MIMIQPNNKTISERRKAELRGELELDFINQIIIEQGYNALSVYQKEVVSDKVSDGAIRILEVEDDEILEYVKSIKIEFFKKTCEEQIELGFTSSNGHFYRTNRDDQVNMIGQKDSLVDDPSITYVDWKTEDVGYIRHTKEQWMQVYNEAFAHKKDQLFKYEALKQQVLAATNQDEVALIQWTEAKMEVKVQMLAS